MNKLLTVRVGVVLLVQRFVFLAAAQSEAAGEGVYFVFWQTITADLGSTPIMPVLVSKGTLIHPTATGRYRVYAKIPSQTMTGGAQHHEKKTTK
jgi:hypothetical protein